MSVESCSCRAVSTYRSANIIGTNIYYGTGLDRLTSVTEQDYFFVRELELSKLLDILDSHKRITLIVGEAGIGKSVLLDKLYENLKNKRAAYFVGYYTALRRTSLIYPFVAVLKNMLELIQRSEQLGEIMKETTKRLLRAAIEFSKARGTDLASAILQDVVSQLRLVGIYLIHLSC